MTENCRADALRDDCSCQLVAHSPASHSGGGQVEIKPTGIASSPSNAEANRTARTNAMSILMWLAHRSWYGEYASVQQLWLFASACEDAGYFEVSHISLLYKV